MAGERTWRIALSVKSWWSDAEQAYPHSAGDSGNRRLDLSSMASLCILAAMLAIALALRLYKLNAGLWIDEITTYVTYARMPFRQIISTYYSENQNLLYSVFAHASFLIFGESAWSLRLPAVFFGVGSIWALYIFGQQVGSRWEALLSAALLAFSYHHVWFSQNARGYTGLLFWTLLTSWLLVRGMREDWSWRWLFYAAAVALGVYTHLTMLFVVLGHFIIYIIALISRRSEVPKRGKKAWSSKWAVFFLGFCVAGFLTLLLHAPVLPQMFSTIGGTQQSVVEEWKSPLWTILEIVKGLQIGFLGGVVALVALVVFGIGLISYMRTDPTVVQLLIISPLVGATITVGIGHHLWPRFFFFAMGFGALVAIRGSMILGQLVAKLLTPGVSSRVSLYAGTALCIGLILVSALSVTFAYGPKQDYEGALAFVESTREPGDEVVAVGIAASIYEAFYDVTWKEVTSLKALDAIRSRSTRTWLLYTFPPVLRSVSPDIMTSIERDFRTAREFPGTVASGTVFVCLADKVPWAMQANAQDTRRTM